ncbi:MAG TPA: ABC transporter ATP-binding protein, partial [Candidatus Tripitaka californicus]
EEVLNKFRLEGYRHRYPHTLSGGQQQLVALARATASQPRILLMDEPLSNLDVTIKRAMYKEITRLHQELSITTLYVTHDHREAFLLAQRVAVMNGGKIEQIATPEGICRHPASEFVAEFIGV